MEYWIGKLQHKNENLQIFKKTFSKKEYQLYRYYLSKYFYFNNSFFDQVKRTAMDTHAAAVYAILKCRRYLGVR